MKLFDANQLQNLATDSTRALIAWLPSLIVAVLVVVLAFVLSRYSKAFSKPFRHFAPNGLIGDLIEQSLSLLLKFAGILIALDIAGASSLFGALLGTAGVIGLGISFAFKDIIENYLAGLLLSIKQPYLKGEHVLVEGSEGIVMKMTTRMTMLKTFDGNNVSIPNAKIFQSKIENFSRNPQRRFSFEIGINPEADLNFARKTGMDAMTSIDAILKDPGVLSLIKRIADSSVTLEFFGWMDQSRHDFGQVRSLAISSVKETIEAAGIEIPDPSYIIKLRQESKLELSTTPVSKSMSQEQSAAQENATSDSVAMSANASDLTRRESDSIREHLKEEESTQGDDLLTSNAAVE